MSHQGLEAFAPGEYAKPDMRPHNAMNDEEATQASREAAKGGAYGALKYGLAAAVLGGIGFYVSPVYRGLTIQFKT